MTTSRRTLSRRKAANRRRSFLHNAGSRRVCRVEALETRALLAADSGIYISDYWNYKNPTDVNDDGHVSTMDILAIVNALTDGGVRPLSGMTLPSPTGGGSAPSLTGPALTGGEGEAATSGGQTFYVDPNNDGMLNMLDLLKIVNEMTAEGEGAPPLVRFKIEPVVAGTLTPLPQDALGRYLIQEGDYYELRIMAQDTGQLQFDSTDVNSPSRPATFQNPPKTALGLTTAFLDLNFDTAKTEILVNETQIVEIGGSPTGVQLDPSNPTRFTLTFDGVTTAPITYDLVPVFTAVNIRDALITALGSRGRTQISNLRNIEVEPESTSSTRFIVRFINDLASQDFLTMTGSLTNAAGATSVTAQPSVEGNPNNTTSFREMFRGRIVRDQNSVALTPFQNNPQFFDDPTFQPPFLSGSKVPGGVNDGGSASETSQRPFADRSGTQLVEVYRLRMKATDGDGVTPVSFVGSVEELELNNHFVSVHGFTAAIPANRMVFDQDGDLMPDAAPLLLITEPISAVNDTASVNEGSGATVTIDVLDNDLDNTGASNLVILPLTQIDPSQGSIQLVNNEIVYTVPGANFNGVVTFQYTIRDGANAAITDTGTVTVTVKGTNDPPVNSVPGPQTMNEDQAGGLVFSAGNGNAITISDVDAGAADVRVTLTTSGGTLTLNPGATGVLTSVTGDGSGTVVATGSVNELNAALSGLRFTPILHSNGPTSLTVSTSDLGRSAHADNASIEIDTDVIGITITPINDGPVNFVPGPQQIDEGATLTFNAAGGNLISVSDVDADAGVVPFLTVVVSTSQGGTLIATAGGGAAITANNSTSVTITGTVAQVNAALNGLTYFNAQATTDTLLVMTTDNGNTGNGGILSDTDSITIDVLATTRPRAIDDLFPAIGGTILEGQASIFLDVLANDLVHQTPLETPFLVGSPVPGPGFVGTLIQRPAGANGIPREHYEYQPPDGDFFGTITFSYTMNETDTGGDPSTGPDSGNVTLVITNVNDNPVANPDSYNTDEDVPLIVSNVNLGVLLNDTDPDNRSGQPVVDTLTAELVVGSAVGGSVALNSNGTFTFTPTAEFNGAASFMYRVRDGKGGVSAAALVSISVAPLNDAPVANPDTYGTTEGTNLTVNAASGLLANDTDVDNQSPPLNAGLTVNVASVTQPAQGSVAVLADGSFTYSLPNSDFNGQVTFTYQARDSAGALSPPATVTINIAPLNDPPVAGNATYPAVENQTRTVGVGEGLLRTNNPIVTDVDTPLSGITVAVVTPPSNGTFNLAADGSFTYTPPQEFNGQVTFTYQASDGPGSFSNIGTITIDVAAVNDAPTANPNSFETDEEAAITITAAQLLGNDTDPENATLTISFVSALSGPGTLVQNPNGSLTFTPAPGFPAPALAGNVTFQYRVTDGLNQSNLATVTITVIERNDDPIANDDTADDVVKDILNQLISPSPLANDSAGQDAGVPGEILVISSVGGVGGATTQGGVVRLVGQQVFYDPPAGFDGTDTFTYTLSDSRGRTDTATVTVEVLDFVPKSVGGTVYIDADNDGVLDVGERRLGGVRVDLAGSTVIGAYAEFMLTDANGNYSFSGLAPGNYTLTQTQPLYLTSGKDSVNTSPITADSVTNVNPLDNLLALSWTPLDFDGNITGLNFGERGINTASLADSSGLLGEILASSSQNGMIFSVDAAGSMDWSYSLNGWNTTASCQLEIAANGSIPSILVTIGGVTKRIYQDPHNNNGGNTPPAGSQARFRVLGKSATGDYIIRLDGELGAFGFAAAAVPQGGEGESAVELSEGQYRESADAVFENAAWA